MNIKSLPDKWRSENRQSGWSFESDKGDELEAAMPVGTMITEDKSTWPAEYTPFAYRIPLKHGWTFVKADVWLNEKADKFIGCMSWPIPQGMFEPPEDMK